MDHHSRHHPTNDNDTAIPGSGSSTPKQPAQDDDDSELDNSKIAHTPPAVSSPSKGSRDRRTQFLPGAGSSHQLLQAKSAIVSSSTARTTGYSADGAARRDNNKTRKNPVVSGASHRSYAAELFVDDDDDKPEVNEQQEVGAAATTTTTIEEKQSPIPRHDMLLQVKSRIRSQHHHHQQQQQRLQQSPVSAAPSTNTTAVDDDDADRKKKIRSNNNAAIAITPTRRRSDSLESVEWDQPPPMMSSSSDHSGRSSPTPPGFVEDSVYRNSRSFPSVDYNGALTAVVVEDPPSLLPAVVVNIKVRRRIIGAIAMGTLLVMAALVTALTLTARANRRPTVVVVDKSEWVSIVNSATLSGQVLVYPPPTIGASVEERALAWLIDVENDQVPMRSAVQHYAVVVLALAWNYTNNNTEWQLQAGFDECELHGITCDNVDDDDDDSTCIAMELPSAMLKGSIPADIGLLTNLRELDLSRNFLSGTVPWEPMMRSMSHLEVLDLSDSYFTGPLPVPRNGSWPALKTFWVQWNSLNGTISSGFAHWPSLEDFDVSQNNIVGTLRSELGEMSTLRTFAIFSNKISGSIPTEFGGLSRLEYFDIEGNGRMNGTIPTELGQWTRMVDFYCHDNQISGSIPTELGQWTNLAIIQAEYNKLTGSIPTEVEQWTNMRNFFIDHNEISGSLPAGIGNWTFLEEIQLHNNRLSGAVPSGVASWAKLSVATFQDNNLTGSLEDLCAIAPPDAVVFADSCELPCSCCTSSSDDDDDGVPQSNCTSSPDSP